MQKCISTTMSW